MESIRFTLNLKAEGIRILDALGHMESLNDCGQDVSLAKSQQSWLKQLRAA